MRLSEAILLGDSLKKADPWFYSADPNQGDGCGCAIAGARLAAGLKHDGDFPLESESFVKQWPWVTEDIISEISIKYFAVAHGRMTIEQLVDFVRSIEPADPEPPTVDEMEAMYQKQKLEVA